MADHQLPAHLQNRQVQDFTDYAGDGLGTLLPPHVSIQGNMFTLVDATGQEYQPLPTMEAVIVDRSNFACKMYYDKPWVPGSDEPPVCWSTNGVGPSKDAPIPQSRSCQECQFNVRGSAISKISGASIKACRDEYHMALLLPTIPDMLFRYVLTPGSFENWQNYVAKFKNSNVKISMVVTQMSFQPKVNGVVMFNSVSYTDTATEQLVVRALLEKKTDALVGRNDVPRTAALAAPVQQPVQIASMQTLPANSTSQQVAEAFANIQQPAQQVQQPAPFVPSTPAQQAPPVASQMLTAGPAAASQQPAVAQHDAGQPAPTPRRRRRTAAEMQAAQPGQPAPASPGQMPQNSAPASPGQMPQAPFPHPGQAAAPQQLDAFPQTAAQPVGQPQFGMAEGQPASGNPEVSQMLDNFFKQS